MNARVPPPESHEPFRQSCDSAVRCPFRCAQEGEFLVKLFFKKVVLKRAELRQKKLVSIFWRANFNKYT